jgi:hypothetical protein
VVFAPFEADHQLVSLQRAGIIDIILSEDGDLTHLGARAGSVLSNYITRRATGYRYQYYQPDSTARPRSIRAALLGTDYNHNLNLVNWNMVDATTEKLVLGLGGSVDFGDLVDSVELLRLCEAKASRTRTRTIVPKELDDGGDSGGGDDDDGDYSEEEDIDEFIDWALAVDAEEAERAALEAYHSNFGGGYSGGDRASASVLYSRVVDGAGTRSEPIAMLAEIATWTYSPAPPRASVDSVVEHTGFVTAASIRAATADDLALKANTATVRLRGYQREGTERQFHACFCDQILHAVGRGLLQCDTILAHYVVMVREEVDAALAAWTGLPAQQASPPPPPVPTGLAWAELAAVLPGRWLVLGAPRLGFACEAVSVSAVVDGSATGTYTDRGAAGTFKLTVAVSGHGST